MAIDFNIGLRTLQTLGEEASRNQAMQLNAQQAQIARERADQQAYVFGQQQQQDQARPGLVAQARRGDYMGAQDAAVSGGDFDLAKVIGGLREDQLQQFQHQADVVGNLVPQLKDLPIEQRAQAGAQVLLNAGFTPQQVQGMDWSDAGIEMQYQLSAAGKAALAARMKAAEPYTLAPGSRRYSGTDILAENPAEPKYQAVPEGGMLVRTDGGTATPVYSGAPGVSAQPSQATGGRYQFGWTPRARNGGDNSDAAVDGKIAGMARALGIDPDGDLTGVDPMKIARALAISEGGAGSLADRNNNPGNLRDPKTGAYRQFGDKNAGLQAASAQVRRNLARGQTSIRTMVEGLPVGGGQRQQGGTPGVIYGRPKRETAPSGYRYNGDTLEPIPGGPADPSTSTNRSVQSNRKAEADFRKEFEGRKDVASFRAARTQFNALRDTALNPKATAQDDIAVIFQFMKTLDPTSTVREGEFATAQNAGGIPDTIRNAFNKAQNGERLNDAQRRNMARTAYRSYQAFRDAYNQTAEQFRGYARDNGINPDRVARTYTPDKPARQAAPSRLTVGQSTSIDGIKITRMR